MARFIGSLQGARGGVTRLGHATTGITVVANGWNAGVKVYGSVNSKDEDCFEIFFTGGSNGGRNTKLIARITGESVEVFK